ncbi:MAG: lipoprotein signal peptidase [Flavobacteriales bacterium]
MSKSAKLSLLTIFLILFVDQAVKIWVKTKLVIGEVGLDWGWFKIHFIENRGMAFGWEFAGEYGKVFLSVFRIFAAVAIAWYIRKLIRESAPQGLVICVSLVFAGAVGNIIDSAFYGILFSDSYVITAQFLPEGGGYAGFLTGNVVDMLHIDLTWPQWVPWLGGGEVFPPIFNIADSAITLGIGIIFIKQRSYFKRRQESVKTTDEPELENSNPSIEPEKKDENEVLAD